MFVVATKILFMMEMLFLLRDTHRQLYYSGDSQKKELPFTDSSYKHSGNKIKNLVRYGYWDPADMSCSNHHSNIPDAYSVECLP